MSLELRELLKEQAYDDCVKYGTPTPGVDHSNHNRPNPYADPTGYVELLSFDELIKWCISLEIPCNTDRWLDDDFPDKEDGLRVKLIDALERRE